MPDSVDIPPRDWTQGPAKWAAAVVLGAACVVGMTWSIVGRVPRPSWTPATSTAPPAATGADRPAAPATDAPASETAIPATSLAARVRVNTATQAELEMLPGIGPALAKRIIEYRQQYGPFKTINSLDAVPGIGPRTLERLRPLVTTD